MAFDREVETRIYNTLPHYLGTLLRRHPVGREEGTRLYPMEIPVETADTVLAMLTAMTAMVAAPTSPS